MSHHHYNDHFHLHFHHPLLTCCHFSTWRSATAGAAATSIARCSPRDYQHHDFERHGDDDEDEDEDEDDLNDDGQ